MNIFITGGAGYIGTRLTGKLLETGHKVTVLDTFWFGNYLVESSNLRVITGDILSIRPEWLHEIDVIIHLAAVANDPSVELNPMLSWEIGALGTRHVFENAILSGVERILVASSGSVYGVKEESQVTEDLSLIPISVYNKVKMIKERVALSYKDNISLVIFRPATVCGYSPRMRLDLAVNALTYDALSKGIIKVDGGKQFRPHLHMDDMVRAYMHMIDNPGIEGTFNVGFENMTIRDLATKISEETGAKIEYSESNDPRSYRLDSSRLLSNGFIPSKTVQDAIIELKAKFENGDIHASDDNYNVKAMKKKSL
jgi:nucleoside-diphosphate-sugar epimerase